MAMDGLYLLMGAFLFIGAALLALQLLQCFALYRMAVTRGFPHPWMAWVPYCQSYLLGCLCDRARSFRGGRDWRFRWILPVTAAVSPSFVPLLILQFTGIPSPFEYFAREGSYGLHSLLQFAATAAVAAGLYFLYADYAPGQEGIYTVLTVLFQWAAPAVILFILRERLPLSAGGHPPAVPRYQGPGTTGPGSRRAPQPPPGPPWSPAPPVYPPVPPESGPPPKKVLAKPQPIRTRSLPPKPPAPPEDPPVPAGPREGWYQPQERFQQPFRSPRPGGRDPEP